MAKATWKSVWIVLALVIGTGQLFAAGVVLKGVVTDDAGKPVRGAIVTATSGTKSVSKYSQNDGRYEMKIRSRTAEVAVDAFGFALKRQFVDTTKSIKVDLKLTSISKLDVTRLTPAEIASLLPHDDPQMKLIRRACWGCHSLQTVTKLRGMPAVGWDAFLPTMTRGRLPPPDFDRLPAGSDALGEALEKYFGPSAPYFGPLSEPRELEQVKHAEMSDAALKATIIEYQLPTPGAMPNGVVVDKKDRPWWDEYDASNEVGEFDPVTEQFHIYPILPHSVPKDSVVGKNGSVWYALNGLAQEAKLAKVNPNTGYVTYYKSTDPGWHAFGTHTLALDPQGNIWSSGHYPAVFDIQKDTFHVYQLPVSKSFPEGSVGTWTDVPGLPKASPSSAFNSYNSVGVDSKGLVYLTKFYEGTVIRLDPATGLTKEFRAPGMVSPHGIIVDSADELWFCDGFGGTLDNLDPKTGKVNLYHPPTANAQPFGATIDKRTGYIYFGDHSANAVTRFDPKTETFIEYPLPTPESMPRYVDVDSKGRIWYGVGGPYASKIGMIDPGTTPHR